MLAHVVRPGVILDFRQFIELPAETKARSVWGKWIQYAEGPACKYEAGPSDCRRPAPLAVVREYGFIGVEQYARVIYVEYDRQCE